MENTRAILVISFGTSYPQTREKTIDKIENEIQRAFPQYPVYRAWTSGRIRKKLLERDGIRIMNIAEALEQMKEDGVREVLVQPTYILRGFESDRMLREVEKLSGMFDKVLLGEPLLGGSTDKETVLREAVLQYHPGTDEALIFMGHGTEHEACSTYLELDDMLKRLGYENVFMGTVECRMEIRDVLQRVKALPAKKILLAPFMMVAGDHATNDMAGDEEDSWKNICRRAGYEVECFCKGLGELSAVHRIFTEHVDAVRRQMDEAISG